MDAERTAVFGAFKYIRAPQFKLKSLRLKDQTVDPLNQRLKPKGKTSHWMADLYSNDPADGMCLRNDRLSKR